MKPQFLLLVALMPFFSLSQEQTFTQKKANLITELNEHFREYCSHNSETVLYYNTEEKILDYNHYLLNLETTKVEYGSIQFEDGLAHFLYFICIDGSDCIEQGSKNFIPRIGFLFDSKKDVYHAIDLLYALENLK